MDSIGYLDELIKEYLLFRGYIKTYTSFTSEKIHDKTDHPDPDTIAEQLLNHIRQQQLTELTDLWHTLSSRFFTHLPPAFTPTIRMIEQSLKRAYLVKAVKTGDKDKVREFYERFATEMTAVGGGWEEWFILPYLKDPSVHPIFSSYFNKRWFHTLALSVKNFLTSAFAQIPLPKLMAFNVERTERKALTQEIKAVKADNEKLRRELAALKQQLNNSKPTATATNTSPPPTTAATLTAAAPALSHSLSQPLRPPFLASPQTPTSGGGGTMSNSGSAGAFALPVPSPSSATPAPDDDLPDPPFLVTHDVTIPAASSAASSAIAKVRFSVDGTRLAAGSRDGSIRIFSVERMLEAVREKQGAAGEALPSLLSSMPAASAQSDVTCMEWDARKDSYVAYGGNDGRVRLWAVESRKVVGEMEMTRDFPVVLSIASSPSDKYLVSAAGSRQHATPEGGKGVLEAWDAGLCKRVLQFTVESALSQINSLVFNHNGSMLVTGGGDGMIRIFDMSTKKPIMGWPAHQGQLASVRLCSDETTVLSAGMDGRIVEWSLHRIGKTIRLFSSPSPPPPPAPGRDIVRAELAMDGDNEHFLLSSSSPSSAAFLYDINAARPVMTAGMGPQRSAVSVDWHPTVAVVAAGGADGGVRVRGMIKREGWVLRGEGSRVDVGEEEEDDDEDGEDGEDEEDGEEGDDDEDGEDAAGEDEDDDY